MGRYPWERPVSLTFSAFPLSPQYVAMIYLVDPLTATSGAGVTIASHFRFTAYLLFVERFFPYHWGCVRDGVYLDVDADDLDQLPPSCPTYHPAPNVPLDGLLSSFIRGPSVLSPALVYRLHHPTGSQETYITTVPLFPCVPLVPGWGSQTSGAAGETHSRCANFLGTYIDEPLTRPPSDQTYFRHTGTSGCGRYTTRPLCGVPRISVDQMFAGLGRLVANKLLRLVPARDPSPQLYLNFFLSRLLCFVGDVAFEKRTVCRSFKSYLLQAVVITWSLCRDTIMYFVGWGDRIQTGEI